MRKKNLEINQESFVYLFRYVFRSLVVFTWVVAYTNAHATDSMSATTIGNITALYQQRVVVNKEVSSVDFINILESRIEKYSLANQKQAVTLLREAIIRITSSEIQRMEGRDLITYTYYSSGKTQEIFTYTGYSEANIRAKLWSDYEKLFLSGSFILTLQYIDALAYLSGANLAVGDLRLMPHQLSKELTDINSQLSESGKSSRVETVKLLINKVDTLMKISDHFDMHGRNRVERRYASRYYRTLALKTLQEAGTLQDSANIHAKKAEIYRLLGQLELAQQEGRISIKMNPRNWKTYLELGKIAEEQSNTQLAEILYTNGVKLDSENEELYLHLADAIWTNQLYWKIAYENLLTTTWSGAAICKKLCHKIKVIELLARTSSKAPTTKRYSSATGVVKAADEILALANQQNTRSPIAQILRWEAMISLGEKREGRLELERALNSEVREEWDLAAPRNRSLYFLLIEQYLQDGDKASAERIFKKALSYYPWDIHLLQMQARAFNLGAINPLPEYYSSQKSGTGTALPLIATWSKTIQSFYTNLYRGNFTWALAEYRALIHLQSGTTIDIYTGKKSIDKERLQKLVTLESTSLKDANPKAKGLHYLEKGRVLYDIGNYLYYNGGIWSYSTTKLPVLYYWLAALEALDQSIYYANTSDAHAQKGVILLDIGWSPNLAKKELEIAIQLDPRNSRAYFKLWNLVRDQWNEAWAIRIYSSGLLVDPYFELTYLNLGNTYIAHDRLNLGLYTYTQWLAICKNFCHVLDRNIGLEMERAKKDYELAFMYLTRAIHRSAVAGNVYRDAYAVRGSVYASFAMGVAWAGDQKKMLVFFQRAIADRSKALNDPSDRQRYDNQFNQNSNEKSNYKLLIEYALEIGDRKTANLYLNKALTKYPFMPDFESYMNELR